MDVPYILSAQLSTYIPKAQASNIPQAMRPSESTDMENSSCYATDNNPAVITPESVSSSTNDEATVRL